MQFRITEPVFFLGANRRTGDVLEAPVGPYKSITGQNGRPQRIPQFEVILPDQPPPLPNTTPLPVAAPVVKPAASLTGLDNGLIGAAIERAKQRLVAKAHEGVAKIETAVATGEKKLDGVTSNLAAKVEKEIEDQVSAFRTMTNGAPV